MNHNRGDIVLVLYPDSNLRSSKRRPVLIIQANNLATGISQTIVAMISSNLSRTGHPSRVSVSLSTPAGQKTGLRQDSVIMTDNLATINDAEIAQAIGVWTDMHLVDAALRHTLGL